MFIAFESLPDTSAWAPTHIAERIFELKDNKS